VFNVCANVKAAFERCPFGRGVYPCDIQVNVSVSKVQVQLYTHLKMLTVNGILSRNGYPADSDRRVVVDLGSNIGISSCIS
jgi:hypothetical protein